MSKPKQSEYKASEAEKANAAVAMADKKYFRENYLPKQREFIERSFNEEAGLMSMGEGRAQADTMQALTSNPNRRAVAAVDAQADLAAAAGAQQLQGTAQGLMGARSDQISGIKSANQMASQTASGLSQASKIATTDTLNRAKAKQIRRAGLIKAGTTLGVQAGKNFSQYRAAESLNAEETRKNTDKDGNLQPGGDYIPMDENANIFQIAFGRGLGDYGG
tara:strand:- start:213 stop:872 length:660 start_codon:yes stop_codon:yes gene_type:complete